MTDRTECLRRGPRGGRILSVSLLSNCFAARGTRLHVRGVDMLDGTPILDIKPYLSNIPEEKLRRGWLAEVEARKKK
jgi:tRNA (adenine37-N6)-methyltransferase